MSGGSQPHPKRPSARYRPTLDDYADAIDAWHESDSGQPLHEWLGITSEKYRELVAPTCHGPGREVRR